MKINELLNQNPYISATFRPKPYISATFNPENPTFLLPSTLILATLKNKSLYLRDL